MPPPNESIEEFYSYLFAVRIALQDRYENESDIIIELKKYLLDIGELPDTISQTLYNFYQHFGINIQLNTIEQISIINTQIFNNILGFILNNSNESEDNESSSESFTTIQVLSNGQTYTINSQSNLLETSNEQVNTSSTVYSHNNMISLLNTIINELGNQIDSDPITSSFQDVIVTVDDSDLEKLISTKLESKLDIDCSICMGNMDKDDMSTELKCSHIFHTDCIKPYLQQYNYKCPICRTEVGKAKYNM